MKTKKLVTCSPKNAILFFAISLTSITSCRKSETHKPQLPAEPIVYKTANIAVPASGLIAYWSFDGTANDLSGNANHGTKYNITSATDRFGNPIGAYHFDGSTSYISVADNSALRLNSTDFTMNAWIKMDSYNSSIGSEILSKRTTGANNGWQWSVVGTSAYPYTAGTTSYGPGGGSTNAYGSTVVPTGEWHMVTCVYTYSAQQLKIYVDGVLDSTTGSVATPNSTISALLYIGRDNPAIGTSYFFEGSMDDISLYNSALSASSISNLFSATASKPSPNLLAFWPLNNTANDLSGNWNNGLIKDVSSATDRFSNQRGAYYFNGTSSYISVADKADLRLNNTDFTVNAWIKMDVYNSGLGSVIVGKLGAGTNNGWVWAVVGNSASPYTAGITTFDPADGGTQAFGSSTVSLNTWHMVTCVYTLSTQQLKIYIDGSLDTTTNSVPSPNASATAMLYIGRNNPAIAGNYFKGYMEDISIYNSALSLSNIQQLYNATN